MSLLALTWLASAAWAGELTGVVLERGTGDPVPGALVVAEGGEAIATAGPRGRFTTRLDDGAHALQVLSPGHRPEAVEVVLPGPPLEVYLVPAPGVPEVVVEARRASPHVVQRVLDRERVEKTAGTHDDPIRLLQSLPGVALTPEYGPSAGDLAVRGAAPADSTVLLDGVQLPYLYHFQQYASVLHTRLLDELALYPSAYGPAYGGNTGGVAAVTTRRADPARLHAGANVNAIMAGAYVQAPLTSDWAASGSARRSYADLYEDSNDQYTAWPAFWDYLARVDGQLGPDDHVALTAIGAGDRYGRFAGDTEALDPVEQARNPGFESERGFHGGIATWTHDGAEAAHRTSLGVVGDRWRGGLPTAEQRRDERSAELRHSSVLQLGGPWQLSAGGDLRAVEVARFARSARAWPELAGEAPLLARGVDLDESLGAVRGGVFVEPIATVGAFDLRPALRVQGDTAVGSVAPEPRLGLRLTATDAVQLRLAGGRYTQAPSLDALSPAGGDPTLGLADSWQAAAGVDLVLWEGWELSLDGYGRRLWDAVTEAPGVAPVAQDGVAYGAELLSSYRVRERFFSWVGLTVGRSLREGQPYAYDQPWSVTAVVSWDVTERWNLGARYRASAGLPYTPILGGVYDGDRDAYAPSLGGAFSARLPTYQKLDGHLQYTVPFRRWTLATYLEGWWVPASSNNLYPVYSYDFSEQALVAGPGFVPLLGLRAQL